MACSQATAGLRGGAVRDSGQHSNSELTRLGPASARRPGPQQGRGGFSPRVAGHDGEAAVKQRKKIGSSACCRGSRAARRRLQQVRLLLRGGDLTTDGSGLGVGVPGSGRSGFAADTHRNSSSGGLAGRPDSGVVVLRRGDGLQLHRPAAQQCSSLSPQLLLLPFSPSLLAVDRGKSPMGRRRGTGRRMGRLLVGWRLGFGARERTDGMQLRGTRWPSAAASAAGRGGGHGAMALASPLPRAPTVRHGEDSREKEIRPDRRVPRGSE
jgi:hypothetical protein